MKNKTIAVCTIFVLVGVGLGIITLLVHLLIWLGNDLWQTFNDPVRLAKVFRELLESIGYLGLWCLGIIIFGFIVGFIGSKIPPSWVGRRESNDDDYWYHDL